MIRSWTLRLRASAASLASFADIVFEECVLERGFFSASCVGVRLFSHSCIIVETVRFKFPGVKLSSAGHCISSRGGLEGVSIPSTDSSRILDWVSGVKRKFEGQIPNSAIVRTSKRWRRWGIRCSRASTPTGRFGYRGIPA